MMNATKTVSCLPEIQTLIARGALFVVNNSGGKDSQAMLIAMRELVPASQLLVVHADLNEVEWPGTQEHAKAISLGLTFITTKAQDKAGKAKTFFDMVFNKKDMAGNVKRPYWPSPSLRQCTSDLKRGPIERAVRGYLKANKQFNGLVVNCMGLRAQESDCRAEACEAPLKLNAKNSKAGREWYDYLPIATWRCSTDKTFDAAVHMDDVFTTIALAGQTPHYAYALGASRLSCAFCIMASIKDLTVAALWNPALYSEVVGIEKQIGHTIRMGKGLEEVTGIMAGRRSLPVLMAA